jgi:glycosyltransferase involved in cell wall biosynthesis
VQAGTGFCLTEGTVNILFVHNYLTRFVSQDLDALRKQHRVSECSLTSRLVNPLSLWRKVRAHDAVFGWFASWHTVLPMAYAKLLHKPSILVVGGYDLASMPEIGYGHQRGGPKKWLSGFAIRMAQCLITNSHYSATEATRNAGVRGKSLNVVYHGVPDPFFRLPGTRRERVALTVGNVERSNLRRKGLEPFVRTAALLPDVKFVVAGSWKDGAIRQLQAIATANVEFTGWLEDAALLEWYRRASVYVQASLHEGFGMAVAEAMLAGCIPVVMNVGALPEVVGDCGVYCRSPEPADIASAIERALAFQDSDRSRARGRILDQFPPQARHQSLDRILAGLVH